MKTKLFLGVAAALALNCSVVNADVLGGNVAGGLGGSLGGGFGGVRDMGAVGHGSGQGAFGADLDASQVRRSTRNVAERATRRTDSRLNTAVDRSRSTVRSARHAGKGALSTANEQAMTTANLARGGGEFGANAAANASHDALASATKAQGTAAAAGSATSQVQGADLDLPRAPDAQAPRNDAAMDGSLGKSVGGGVATDSPRAPLTTGADAAAEGGASASRDGVSARGSAEGSASVGVGR